MRTSRVEVSIHAVSPLSTVRGAGAAGAAGAGADTAGAGAAGAAGAAGCCAEATTAPVAARTRISTSARLNRFTRVLLLKGALIALARPDSDGHVDRCHEDLPVADVPRLRRTHHDVGHLLDEVVGHHHLHLDLGEEVDRVLAAAVQLRVPFLAPEATHFRHGHADDADSGEGFLDVVQLERLDDRLDLFHRP